MLVKITKEKEEPLTVIIPEIITTIKNFIISLRVFPDPFALKANILAKMNPTGNEIMNPHKMPFSKGKPKSRIHITDPTKY